MADGPSPDTGAPVVFNHATGDHSSLRTATTILNTYDAVSIQHEFGIYGGQDGIEVVDLMAGLEVPAAVTLHTVLSEPTQNQRRIMEAMCNLAERIVVMSQTACERLVDRYQVDPSRISVIPHGADPMFAGPSPLPGDRPLILTWGLIGPGKGLEWAIAELADLVDMRPLPRYLISGATHPHVRRSSGESYREGLRQLTADLRLEAMIEFDDRYMSRGRLARLVRSADVVVLPYESMDQVTSGVLVEAIAASKPVIATSFPHAVEVLSSGAGALVPFGEPHRLANELRRVLSNRGARSLMARRAQNLASDWYWPTVGQRFAEMLSDIGDVNVPFAMPALDRQRVAG
jgi:glycosyltransferase involved in cell wall biosynthesis